MNDKILHRGRKITLVQRTVVDDRGDAHAFEVVLHPGAAVVLPILDEDRVLMIRNYRTAVDATLLELPAGTIDPPETPLSCAQRELAEETGYSATRVEALASFYSTPGFCDELMHVFVATGLIPGKQALEANEKIALSPIPYDDALAAVRDGRIRDAKSLAALLYYDRFRRRNA